MKVPLSTFEAHALALTLMATRCLAMPTIQSLERRELGLTGGCFLHTLVDQGEVVHLEYLTAATWEGTGDTQTTSRVGKFRFLIQIAPRVRPLLTYALMVLRHIALPSNQTFGLIT